MHRIMLSFIICLYAELQSQALMEGVKDVNKCINKLKYIINTYSKYIDSLNVYNCIQMLNTWT